MSALRALRSIGCERVEGFAFKHQGFRFRVSGVGFRCRAALRRNVAGSLSPPTPTLLLPSTSRSLLHTHTHIHKPASESPPDNMASDIGSVMPSTLNFFSPNEIWICTEREGGRGGGREGGREGDQPWNSVIERR